LFLTNLSIERVCSAKVALAKKAILCFYAFETL